VLVGNAPVGPLGARAARVEQFSGRTVELPRATVVLANFELPYAVRESLLPPALHPNTPPVLAVLAWSCPESPWGPFSFVQLRAGCRSGVRSRGFLLGAGLDNRDAADALASGWGLATRPAEVTVRPGYDATSVTVAFTDGAARLDALQLRLFDPDPLGLGDVQYTGTLAPADTGRGLRLVQFEPDYAVQRAERAKLRLDGFDAAAWGAPDATPRGPIVASVATATITVRPVRFVCRADVNGFEGTEPVEPVPVEPVPDASSHDA
jgi:hypothetical protein